MKDQLIRYARAGYAGLFLCTPEEARAEAIVKVAADELPRVLPSRDGAYLTHRLRAALLDPTRHEP